ncbi:MAG: Cys-tRNA(Pro) deacylase [Clostridia bacterium]
MLKTNAMRLLDLNKISYKIKEYDVDENDLSGIHVAQLTNIEPDSMFKTLVTKGDKNGINIFCIPINHELNLKKAANVSKNKKIEMILMKDLLSTTGYIRGGCSPIGMKKPFPIYLDETAELFDEIAISGGARGIQIILDPINLSNFIKGKFFDLT